MLTLLFSRVGTEHTAAPNHHRITSLGLLDVQNFQHHELGTLGLLGTQS